MILENSILEQLRPIYYSSLNIAVAMGTPQLLSH
jgi:hypothetical protein